MEMPFMSKANTHKHDALGLVLHCVVPTTGSKHRATLGTSTSLRLAMAVHR